MIAHFHSLSKLEFDKILSRIEAFAATELGKTRIRQLAPWNSVSEIQGSLKRISEMKYLVEADVPPSFDGIVDCRASIHRASIEDSMINGSEMKSIASMLKSTRNLKGYFGKRETIAPLLNMLAKELSADKVLEFNITRAIDEKGEAKDDASAELSKIRRAMFDLRENLRTRLNNLLRGAVKRGWAQDEIVTTRDGRMVIPVKADYKHQVPGFIHSASSSGMTVFIEPSETLEMNNEIRGFQFQEQREVEKILKDLTSQIRANASTLLATLSILVILDTTYAAARYSVAIGGAEPKIETNGYLSLKEARHPILLEQLPSDATVPLNVELGKNFVTLLITGPNAGGKSVALKTVGLITAMAHTGLHVPASADSVIPFMQGLYVDIGDEQSIENNLSTFTSHLNKLKIICEEANSSSMILVDEICAGTDPAEGAALAAAILQKLTARRCYTIATTHSSFLKAFAHESSGIENASMEFNQVSLTPTYRLRLGTPGSSYALEIADRLGLSKEIATTARNFLGVEGQKLERLIGELEKRLQEIEHTREALSRQQKDLDAIINTYQTRLGDLARETREIKRKAVQEAQRILDKANSVVEHCIREIRESDASRSSIAKVKSMMRSVVDELGREQNDIEQQSDRAGEFAVGDYVRFKTGNEVGEVIEILDDNHLLLLSGTSKIKVKKDLLLRAGKETVRHSYLMDTSQLAGTKQSRIDIRGMSGEEAVQLVDKFLDDALVAGFQKLEIIHGKGEGVLRKRIAEYLQSHTQVRSFQLGEWYEGGGGVTVVELK